MPEVLFDFTAHGKLLLTAEYFVLDGVPALAVPTRLGQRLRVVRSPEPGLRWRAFDHRGECWFTTHFPEQDWARTQVPGEEPRARIGQLLHAAESLRPGATTALSGLTVETFLGFDRAWGLGSSSTLVAAVARWLAVDPYALLEMTFGGSGYDLACAVAKGPILYQRNGSHPLVTPLDWHPAWLQQSWFVYRGQKQNSRDGIRAYRQAEVLPAQREAIAAATLALLSPTLHLRSGAQILAQHEAVVAATLGLEPVQSALFPDFPGQLKSLGAWGGDFIWALSEAPAEKIHAYFNDRGFSTVIAYEQMVG